MFSNRCRAPLIVWGCRLLLLLHLKMKWQKNFSISLLQEAVGSNPTLQQDLLNELMWVKDYENALSFALKLGVPDHHWPRYLRTFRVQCGQQKLVASNSLFSCWFIFVIPCIWFALIEFLSVHYHSVETTWSCWISTIMSEMAWRLPYEFAVVWET